MFVYERMSLLSSVCLEDKPEIGRLSKVYLKYLCRKNAKISEILKSRIIGVILWNLVAKTQK